MGLEVMVVGIDPNSGVIRVVNSEGVFNIDELDLALFALLS